VGERAGYFHAERKRGSEEPSGIIEPLALRAVRASVIRRRALISSTDHLVANINAQVDGRDRKAPTPPDLPAPHRAERDHDVEDDAPRTARKQKLANLALGGASNP
jgi:hypothetical protein